jgi:hypothetical protein
MTNSTKTDLSKGTASRRTGIDPALSDDLLERVLAPENLRKAWHQVRTNHGAPGVDGMTNQWLTETLGLVSIRTLWISLHYPT